MNMIDAEKPEKNRVFLTFEISELEKMCRDGQAQKKHKVEADVCHGDAHVLVQASSSVVAFGIRGLGEKVGWAVLLSSKTETLWK